MLFLALFEFKMQYKSKEISKGKKVLFQNFYIHNTTYINKKIKANPRAEEVF